MRIIVPMAGMGKRLRPHTLTSPKPLFPIAGKPIVQRLVEDLAAMYPGAIEEIAFIVGDFGPVVEQQLLDIANSLGTKGSIYQQEEALGTAHAIYCAAPLMDGDLIIAFADTLFTANFQLDRTKDGVIWTQRVEDPRAFGVVTLDAEGIINGMVEKPTDFVSDQAIIGIYYIKDGAALKSEIKHLLDNNIRTKGEYQLTDALEALRQKGARFVPGTVDRWMDCGNKEAVLDTNRQVLEILGSSLHPHPSAVIEHSVIIPPCYIGAGAVIKYAIIGPNTSVGDNATIQDAVVSDSIIRENAKVHHVRLQYSIIGAHAVVAPAPQSLNLGDFSQA